MEIVVTTFETVRDYLEDINTVEWRVVVADECHRIKEESSGITRALKSIKSGSRLGLTG